MINVNNIFDRQNIAEIIFGLMQVLLKENFAKKWL